MDLYPPYEYLCFVADHAPASMSNYLMLWREQDNDSRCIYTKDYIRDKKSLSWSKLLNDLRKLTCQGLLEWAKVDNETVVVTVAQHNGDNGPLPC